MVDIAGTALAIFLVLWSFGASAQETRIELEGLFFANRSDVGRGAKLHFRIAAFPPGGQAALEAVARGLCDQVTYDMVTEIRAAVREDKPEYFAIVLKSGGLAGRFSGALYVYSDGDCGEPLD